jgi:exoribonuclease-2
MTQVLYEEEGAFRVASVLSETDASLQVEAASGKRSKIKSANVLARFAGESLADFMARAEALAAELDPDFLWQVCGPDEFLFADLAREWYGRSPRPAESAAVAVRLHASPMYFYKRGKGRYQAAPEASLKAALASAEKKRRQQAQIEAWIGELLAGRLPDAFATHLPRLLFKPDRNALEVKALEAAAERSKQSIAALVTAAGAFAGADEWHRARFVFERFPDGLAYTGAVDLAVADLPIADVQAFSIDDADTTEIDDAFSWSQEGDGTVRLGIHIAAPALLVPAGGPIDQWALSRLSTVYHPGGKMTMLPDAVIAAATLAEGRACPALSLYLTLDAATLAIRETRTVAERVPIVANLRHAELEQYFTDAHLAVGTVQGPFAHPLTQLHRVARSLKAARGAADQQERQDYTFRVQEGRVTIEKRERGGAIDTLVAELMIMTNATWGRALADCGIAGIYRNQVNGKTRMDTVAGKHEGLGVSHYAWASSPLRRAVDLINQRQLLAMLDGVAALPREALVEPIRAFEGAYEAYGEFQRQMERYWCLVWMQQQDLLEQPATLIRDDLVRFSDLPLVSRCTGIPAGTGAGATMRVAVGRIDPWAVDFSCRWVGLGHGDA